MKKHLQFLVLIIFTSFNGWTQSITFNSVPTIAFVGKNLIVDYKYTAVSAGNIYVTVTKNGGTNPWDYISTVASVGLVSAPEGTDVIGTFTIPIPAETVQTSSLTGNENYRIKIELKDAGDKWLAGQYPVTPLNLVAEAISITSIPISTPVGTNLIVNYKYTVATAGKVSVAVTKNGGTNPWDYISTVGYMELDPASSGTEVTGAFTVPIPAETAPTSSLTGNENYRIIVELKDAGGNWLAGDYNNINYNFTRPITWVGGTSSSWTDISNWDIGVPNATNDVIIDIGIFQPIINENVSIKSLKINTSASLTVNSDYNLAVTDIIDNDGMLTIENNANLIQINDVKNTGSGNTIVKRNSNALSRLDYTSWSSPVTNPSQFLTTFSPLTSTNRFYNYNEATNQYNQIEVPSATLFAVATGYLIRMPNTSVSYPSTTTFDGVFSGVPNNGTINKVLTYNGSNIFGYNLLGNPYPSAIDAQAFINANSNNIEENLYFWRKINNALGSSYAVYNSLGATATPSSTVPNGTIQVGQGFFVKAKSNSSVEFKNEMRVANNDNKFFKTKYVANKDRIWLNLIGNSGVFSQTLIGYTPDAAIGIDRYDAKYINDSPISLTSSIYGEEYTIQGRPKFDATDVVALNFKTDIAGDYIIALDHSDGIFANGQNIYLLDNKTGIETDLKVDSYIFTAATGVENDRFSLKYQKTLGTADTHSFNQNSISVYKNNGTLYVNSKVLPISEIEVFDVQGRLLAHKTNLKTTEFAINNCNEINQVLIVKIKGEDNSLFTKKIWN